jgi:hypothetical protein
MIVKIRKLFVVFIFLVLCTFCNSLPGVEHVTTQVHHSIRHYLLPKSHYLQENLKFLFLDSKMFHSTKNFKKSGFKVKHGHKQLMVGFHPSCPEYLFKKFPDQQSQSLQLKNYIKRIKGAEILRNYIREHNFKHLVVPQKWLYQLPKNFTKNLGTKSFILIVENMNICHKDENLRCYYNMDIEMLTELCMILHDVGGCDAFPRNQPFTRSGKIAFIDTEHVGSMKGHFVRHIVPALNKELQAYALALWNQLEHKTQAEVAEARLELVE